jgi:hypothetical protein
MPRRKNKLMVMPKYWGHSASTWIAVFASFALTFELWFIVMATWHMLEFWGQAALVAGTILIVVIFGYRDSLPSKGVIAKRHKRKTSANKTTLNMGD